jgi:hypothetical protein
MKRTFFAALRLALASLTLTSLALAQSSGADKASAEALFNEGVSLVAAGDYAEGCHKFEGSQALEATLGTVLRLADCYERLGKVASAWATFKQAQGLARVQNQGEREELARQRVDALAPKLTYLRIALEGAPPPGLVVQRNGRPLPLASLGVAIPVDPGELHVTATAPEHEPWDRAFVVAPGPGKTELLIPQLAAKAAPTVTPTPLGATSESPRPAASSTQRTSGIVIATMGAASLVAGSVLGVVAKLEGDRSKTDEFCPTDGHNGCTQAGLDLRSRARGFGTASTVTFLAGALLVTSGIVLFSTAPSGPEQGRQARLELRAAAGPGSFGTTLGGSW